jgi:hypothetical protein
VPTQAARALLFFGRLSMFVYRARPRPLRPQRFVDSGAPRFASAIMVSIIMALCLEKASDMVAYRLAR